MSAPLFSDAKEQVRQAVDIVDLVGGYLQLRRQGRNYVGLCPWHNDTKPSFQVNPERQTFRCWVCDLGGDVFSFAMKMEGLEFREALEMLAERAGIPLSSNAGPKPAPGGPGDKKTLLAAAAWAEEQFARCLQHDPAADPARGYLADRGITADSIARFRLGFAPPSWDWLLGRSRSTDFSPAVLERIGLVRARQDKQGNRTEGHYDFYRGRVIFPIRDVRSRPIAFGGRILPELSDGAGGKYINSPETPLFSKSNQLYALDLARDAIASEGRIVVTEGYTDVVMAHQHGVENVVAVLGTALGEKHLPLIRRFTDSIVLVLDGDEAGQRRTNEVLELFVENQVDLRILGLPDGLDPCDFIAKPKREAGPKEGFGPEAFARLVRQAPDALEHKMRTVTNGLVTASDTHGATRAVEAMLGTLAKANASSADALLREQSILGRLSRRFQIPEDGLRKRLVSLRRAASRPAPPEAGPPVYEGEPQPGPEGAPPPRHETIPPRESELLELLVSTGHARRLMASITAGQLAAEATRRVYSLCEACLAERGEVDFHRLMDSADEQLKAVLVQIDEAAQAKSSSDVEHRVNDVLAAFQRQRDDASRRGDLIALREESLDSQEAEEKLSRFFAKLKDRQTGPLPTEG